MKSGDHTFTPEQLVGMVTEVAEGGIKVDQARHEAKLKEVIAKAAEANKSLAV